MKHGFRLKTSPMISKTINSFLNLACCLFLASCSTSLYFDKTVPPEIPTEIRPCRVAVVNLYNYTLFGKKGKRYQKVYDVAVNKFSEALEINNPSDSLVGFFVADTLKIGSSAENMTLLLPADSVRRMASVFSSDYLITIDSLSLFLEAQEEEFFLDPDDEQAVNYRRNADAYYIADYFLSFYSSSGDLIDRSEVTTNTFLATVPVWRWPYDDLLPVTDKILELTKGLASEAGNDYLEKFQPGYTTERRKIYTGRKFQEANDLIVKREWDKAAELLKKIEAEPNKSLSQRASHNLLVLYEVRKTISGGKNGP